MKQSLESAMLGANVLFDFDGTLMDSGPLHDFAYRKALNERLPRLLAHYDYEMISGKPTQEAFRGLGVYAQDELDALTLAKQRIYRQALGEGWLKLQPGACQLLETLLAIGHTLFLVTSGSHDAVMMALVTARMDHFFAGVVTAGDVAAGKPAPAPFLYCLERFSLAAPTCTVVEDLLNGVVAARKAGLTVIGVHNRQIAERVDLFFASLWDCKQWVESVAPSKVTAP